MPNAADTDKAILMAAFARMDPVALAVALGSVWALMLFTATTILLLKGAPEGGQIGTHLNLIGIYLPGYEVTWTGALIGAVYLLLIGAVTGFILAVLWNMTHYLYVIMTVVRSAWWKMMAD